MNLQQACELAREIDERSGFTLLAIGHFIAPDEVQPGSPWGISLRPEGGRPAVVWSPGEWERLSGPPPSKAAVEKRRDAKHREQLSLF